MNEAQAQEIAERAADKTGAAFDEWIQSIANTRGHHIYIMAPMLMEAFIAGLETGLKLGGDLTMEALLDIQKEIDDAGSGENLHGLGRLVDRAISRSESSVYLPDSMSGYSYVIF